MKCDDIQLMLSDFEDGTLSPAETDRVRRHIESCPTCAKEAAAQRRLNAAMRATAATPEPGPRVSVAFQTWLDAEREAASARARELEISRPGGSWLRNIMSPGFGALAACAVFAGGLYLGSRGINTDNTGSPETLAMAQQIEDLREEVRSMNKAVTWSVLQNGSASDRLQKVLARSEDSMPGHSLNELLGIVAYDSSATVRQNAVEALYRYADDATVRRAVATALPRESSPVVQLAMIDLLATSRDPVAADALATFAVNETNTDVVRDAATYALTRM